MNALTSTGLTTVTQAELVAQFTAAMQSIYGADISLDSNTPDGQMMMIYIQAILDLADLVTQIYNQFDPDNAVGLVLDQRVAINGIQRQAGTFTVTPITIVTSQAVNLYGLDQTTQPVFTVSDSAGTQWQLIATQTISVPGTNSFSFQAANPGQVLTTLNTINVPVTIVLGVTSINNPSTYTTLGIDEESDAELRVRRQKSVALASQGYLSGLLAALNNINGVTSAYVYENTSSAVNGDGVPANSIWVVVAGSGSAALIAEAIYNKRNAGCGMFGTVSHNLTQIDGSQFTVYWDTVVSQPLYIQMTVTSLDGLNAPNTAAISNKIPTLYVPGVFGEVNINALATLVQKIDPNALVTSAGFSTSFAGLYTPKLFPSTKKNQFAITSGNIAITVV